MSTNIFKINYKLGVWCLASENDRLLLVQRTKEPHLGLWIPPGGEIEVGESPLECAIREMHVETGLSVSKLEIKGILTEHSVYGFNWINFIFLLKEFSGSIGRQTREGRLAWIPLKDYHTLPTPEVDKKIIPKVFHIKGFYMGKVIYDENLHIISYLEKN